MATRSRYRAWHECRNACRLSWSITLGNSIRDDLVQPRARRFTRADDDVDSRYHRRLNHLSVHRHPEGLFPQQDTGRITGSIQADQSISFQAMQSKLVEQVKVSNQNVIAAEAQYRQALVLVSGARSQFFPANHSKCLQHPQPKRAHGGSLGRHYGHRYESGNHTRSDPHERPSQPVSGVGLDVWGRIPPHVEFRQSGRHRQ